MKKRVIFWWIIDRDGEKGGPFIKFSNRLENFGNYENTVTQQEVTLLIDYGATYKLVSLELVQKLSLPTTNTMNYVIIVGSGEYIKGKGICRGVVVEILPTIEVGLLQGQVGEGE